MKMKNLFVLAAATLMLVACGEKPTSKETPVSTEATVSEAVSSEAPATSVADSKAPATSAPTSAAPATSATPATSANPATSTATSTSTAGQQTTYEVTFKNTVAKADASKLNDTLKGYINGETEDGFASAIENTSSQVAEVEDTEIGTFRVVQIGSSSKAGSIKITFSKTIKSVTLNVENYVKHYVDQGTAKCTTDTSAKLYVNADSNVVDLKANDGQVTNKTVSFDINSKELNLYVKSSKHRTFVNSITFVL